MKVDIEGENICLNKVVERKNETLIIENDVIVPDVKPDIVSSINTSGNICIYKKEIIEGRVKIDGCIDTYIIYLSDTEDGTVRSLNTSLDFSKTIELSNSTSEMDLDLEFNLKTIDCNVINGRKVNVKAYLEVNIKTYSKEDVQILKEVKDVKGIQKLNKSIAINSLIGRGDSKVFAKDTLSIENIDNLAEILKTEVRVVNRDFKISYNKILAKAEVKTKVMYLTEDNRINTVEKMIPIMGFIDIQNISEENFCDVKYITKNIVVRPNEIEEHSIYVEVELEISSCVYENKQVQLIQDVYSPEQNIKFNQKRITTMSELTKSVNMCTVKQRIDAPEIAGNRIYDTCLEYAVNNISIINEKIVYEGEITAKIIFASSTSVRLDTKVTKIPFSYEIDSCGATTITNIDTLISIKEDNFIVLSDGGIDAQITLEIETKMFKNMEINVINDIEAEETRNDMTYSIIIYFVKKGDTLWNIAKRFRSTVEDIVRTNDIEDENKIYPGQQLLIPRYVVRKIG